jgi:hypothetical protein
MEQEQPRQLTIRIEEGLFQEMEQVRGSISRAAFVVSALREKLGKSPAIPRRGRPPSGSSRKSPPKSEPLDEDRVVSEDLPADSAGVGRVGVEDGVRYEWNQDLEDGRVEIRDPDGNLIKTMREHWDSMVAAFEASSAPTPGIRADVFDKIGGSDE